MADKERKMREEQTSQKVKDEMKQWNKEKWGRKEGERGRGRGGLLSAHRGRNGWILLAEEPPAASYLLAFVNSRHIS